MKNIRNFCIIAHIDHGKSTLADRLLDFTGSVTAREKQDQLLDSMDLERERGITIKSHAIQMDYELNGEKYVLNLIDTPGHVDFSYEVSRSIAACEGALLIVDAAQSIQAQTISNLYLALENDLEIIPVLNKVDLPSANPEEVTDDIVDLLGCDPEEVIHASGKTGFGVDNILKAIIERIPAPKGNVDEPLQALIFDSVYNTFRGVETYFRVFNGEIKKGQKIKFVATDKEYYADEVGTLKLTQVPKQSVKAGDVGYLMAMTGSSDINKYALNKFSKQFGENGSFRLVTSDEMKNPEKNPKGGLFSLKDDYIRLSEVTRTYPSIQEIEIRDKEHYDSLLEMINKDENMIPVFIKDGEGDIHIISTYNMDIDGIAEGYMLVYLGKPLDVETMAKEEVTSD